MPIVILVGDDYQLPPPTNKEKGAFDTMDAKSSFSQHRLGVAASGSQLLTSMSNLCMELTSIKRQNADQQTFKGVLERLRVGEALSEDADFLLSLHLSNFKNSDVEKILSEGVSMHLFATKAPRNEFNFSRLADVSSSNNPVALVKAQWTAQKKIGKSTIMSHFKSPPATAALLSRGAIVRIVDRNFEPMWGLYNNAIGKVVEIVFKPGNDPNNGDLPLYVAARFEHYTGPVWDIQDPKVTFMH